VDIGQTCGRDREVGQREMDKGQSPRPGCAVSKPGPGPHHHRQGQWHNAGGGKTEMELGAVYPLSLWLAAQSHQAAPVLTEPMGCRP
jgi:hypothetical protein